MQPSDRAHLIRIVRLVALAIIVEVCLMAAARLQPALRGLFRPVAWIVAGLFVAAIAHAFRRRHKSDRRHSSDRRHTERRHSVPDGE